MPQAKHDLSRTQGNRQQIGSVAGFQRNRITRPWRTSVSGKLPVTELFARIAQGRAEDFATIKAVYVEQRSHWISDLGGMDIHVRVSVGCWTKYAAFDVDIYGVGDI